MVVITSVDNRKIFFSIIEEQGSGLQLCFFNSNFFAMQYECEVGTVPQEKHSVPHLHIKGWLAQLNTESDFVSLKPEQTSLLLV